MFTEVLTGFPVMLNQIYRAKLVEESSFLSHVDRGGDFLRRKSAFPGPVNGPILLLAIPFAQVVKSIFGTWVL